MSKGTSGVLGHLCHSDSRLNIGSPGSCSATPVDPESRPFGMADTPRSNAKKTTKRSSKPMSKRTTPAVADQSGQDQESAESAGDVETTMHAGAPGARRNEQILLLSLAITCALIGFALHLFLIIA